MENSPQNIRRYTDIFYSVRCHSMVNRSTSPEIFECAVHSQCSIIADSHRPMRRNSTFELSGVGRCELALTDLTTLFVDDPNLETSFTFDNKV